MLAVAFARVCVYVVVSSSKVVTEEKEEKKREEKKSYFIKNGIESLLPACHPSAYDLYKSTEHTQTLVLSKNYSPTDVFYEKAVDRQVRTKKPSDAVAYIFFFSFFFFYLCTFLRLVRVCIRFFLSAMSKTIKRIPL